MAPTVFHARMNYGLNSGQRIKGSGLRDRSHLRRLLIHVNSGVAGFPRFASLGITYRSVQSPFDLCLESVIVERRREVEGCIESWLLTLWLIA